MEQPYVYTVDGKPDQMEHSLTRFTLGQTEGSSTKSYDEYGMLLSVRTDGMAFSIRITRLSASIWQMTRPFPSLHPQMRLP